MREKIIEIFKKYYYILTALLMFLSFPTYDVWILKGYTFFAWFSLIPLFVYIREKSYKDIFISTFIVFLIGNYLVYNWIGHFGAGAGVKGGYILVISVLILSLTVFLATKIIIAEYLSRRLELLRFIIYPSVWIFIDWIQSIGFLAFPWTYWGYSEYPFTAFIQISSIVGIMGITFILILTNYIFSDLIYLKLKNRLSLKGFLNTGAFKRLAILLFSLILITIYGAFNLMSNKKPEKRDLRIASIQSCISPWENWKHNRYRYLSELEHYTNLSLDENPDLIIWSESATLENISYNYENGNLNPFERKVLDIARFSKKSLLTGEIGVIRDSIRRRYYPQNNAVLINEEGRVVKTYPKINLVIFGEWFPYDKWFPLLKDLLDKMGGSNFVPGDTPVEFEFRDKKFGVLICYEGIFYKLCRQYKNLGVDFLVNITNDGWTNSYAGHIQHFATSKFRAIENGIWYVRSGNTGLTALIDPYGRIIKSIPILTKGYLTADIDFDLNHETFYSRYGDLFLYITMIFLFIVIAVVVFLRLKTGAGKTTKQA